MKFTEKIYSIFLKNIDLQSILDFFSIYEKKFIKKIRITKKTFFISNEWKKGIILYFLFDFLRLNRSMFLGSCWILLAFLYIKNNNNKKKNKGLFFHMVSCEVSQNKRLTNNCSFNKYKDRKHYFNC